MVNRTPLPFKVLNNILTAIDKKQYCAAIFIDLAKAFESADEDVMIDRLASRGRLNEYGCTVLFRIDGG